jgi:hypothetical protein
MGAAMATHKVIDSIRLHRQNNHGFKENGWTENIEGYLGEMVVAKALGIYYSAGDGKGFKGADVGDTIQVRWARQSNYRLIVREADSSAYNYVLVTGHAPDYNIRGFISGTNAKHPVYFEKIDNDRPPAYFIPQQNLSPIEGLL